jgi:ubiquitin-conjugating enzyme E2 M
MVKATTYSYLTHSTSTLYIPTRGSSSFPSSQLQFEPLLHNHAYPRSVKTQRDFTPLSPIGSTVKMLKLWSMKQKQQEVDNNAPGGRKKKVTAAQLRVQKDLSELSLGSTMKTHFPDPNDILNFTLTIEPDEGMYKGGKFDFTFAINQNFPHDPPKVLCVQKIYHPNIDLEGKVCLNILREDWKPVLNLNAVIVGMQFLFLEPNASDPLNKTAAEDLKSNREGFKRNVRTAMAGGSVKGVEFKRVLI